MKVPLLSQRSHGKSAKSVCRAHADVRQHDCGGQGPGAGCAPSQVARNELATRSRGLEMRFQEPRASPPRASASGWNTSACRAPATDACQSIALPVAYSMWLPGHPSPCTHGCCRVYHTFAVSLPAAESRQRQAHLPSLRTWPVCTLATAAHGLRVPPPPQRVAQWWHACPAQRC
jgi:hypothetical protein